MGAGGFNPLLLGPLLKILFSKTGMILIGVFLVGSILLGYNPLNLLSGMLGGGGQGFTTESYAPSAEEDELAAFAATILGDTEDVWNRQLDGYREPTLVLFSGYVNSACGSASSATGPFYCPADEKLYIDLSFFHDMESKLRAGGDFAYAYVIAHEVGHHIQKIMGITDGTSNTFMFGETIGGEKEGARTRALIWMSSAWQPTSWGIPTTGISHLHFSSKHAGTVNFAMCDGAVKSVRAGVDTTLFRNVSGKADGSVNGPDTLIQ